MNPQRVPVNLITGFLGVGKTTAIRRLLVDKPADEFWAVLVNEFGEVGIDGAAIESASDQLNVVEVPGGCICCTTSPMLRVSLTKLLRQCRPDRLLIEPSGLGHPAGIIDVLRDPYLQAALDVRATITLVDPRQLNDSRYTTHAIWRDQIALADVLIANKCDRADAEEVDRFLAMAGALYPPKLAVRTTSLGAIERTLLDLRDDYEAESTQTSTRYSPSPTRGRGVGVRAARASTAGIPLRPPQTTPPQLLANARALRESQTDAEHLLWQLLRNRALLEVKFRRQHPVGNYILDFYAPELRLAIELDGGQQAYDQARTEVLNQQGIEVLRFWNNEVLVETESVLEKIYQTLLSKQPSPQPLSHAWERGSTEPLIKDHHEPGQSSRGWLWSPELRFSAEALAQWFQQLGHPANALAHLQRGKGVFHTDHGWLLFNWVGGETSAVEIAWRRDSRCELIVANAEPDWAIVEAALFDCVIAA